MRKWILPVYGYPDASFFEIVWDMMEAATSA
jgi:hypothetical protein